MQLPQKRSGAQLQVPVGGAQREGNSGWTNERDPIYREVLGITETASFVFVMEHVHEGNCHIITSC